MSDSLLRGKERLLQQLFRYISFSLLILIIPSLYIAYTKFIPVLFAVDVIAVSIYFYLAFSNRFSYKMLLLVYLITAFTVAPVILIKTGPYGTGYLWLSSGVILSALYGKKRIIAFSYVCMIIIYSIYGFLVFRGHTQVEYPIFSYLITGINLSFVTLLLSFVIYQLLNMTQSAMDAEKGYAGHLEEELILNEKIRNELSETIEQKSAMLQELNHRVKNNMQVISSLINLTGYNKNHQEYVQVLKNRIRSITAVHYLLFKANDFRSVSLLRLAESISKSIQQNLKNRKIRISIESNSADISIHPDRGVDIALVINEIITNAYKHAFVQGREDKDPTIRISISLERSIIKLQVIDNGIGYNVEKTSPGLGLTLVEKLISQAEASYDVVSNEKGTSVTVYIDNDIINSAPSSLGRNGF